MVIKRTRCSNHNVILVFMLMAFLNVRALTAQQRTTKEAKVVLVVDKSENDVTNIELFNDFEAYGKQNILRKYPNSKFFIGLLKGSYKAAGGGGILPLQNSTITIFTNKEYFFGNRPFPDEVFAQGDQFKLGRVNGEVVSSKKGVLTLKTH